MNFLVVLLAVAGGCLAAPQSVSKALINQKYEYYQPQQVKYYQPQTVKYYQPAQHYVQEHYVQQPVQQIIQPARTYVQPAQTYVQPGLKYTSHSTVPIAIVRFVADQSFDGNFNYDYETENGIRAQAVGQVKNFGTKEAANVMQGSYSYTAPDGTPITTTWFADENGFHAEGDHLPVAPPIPEAIAKSLEYIRSLPPRKEDIYQ